MAQPNKNDMARTTTSAAGSALPGLMQRLPQEIFDQIEKLVFAHEHHDETDWITESAIIDESYHTPSILHVDSLTRTAQRTAYYANTIFVISDMAVLEKWLNALAPEDIKQIRAVHYARPVAEFRQLISPQDEFHGGCYDLRQDWLGDILKWRSLEHMNVAQHRIERLVKGRDRRRRLADFLLGVPMGIQPGYRRDPDEPIRLGMSFASPTGAKTASRDLFAMPFALPRLAREGQRVIVDEHYRAPDMFKPGVTLEMSVRLERASAHRKDYAKNSFFIVNNMTSLHCLLSSMSPAEALCIRRIHIKQADKTWRGYGQSANSTADTTALWALWQLQRSKYPGHVVTMKSFWERASQSKNTVMLGRLGFLIQAYKKQELAADFIGEPWRPRLELSFDGETDEQGKQRWAREDMRLEEDMKTYAAIGKPLREDQKMQPAAPVHLLRDLQLDSPGGPGRRIRASQRAQVGQENE